MDNENKYRIPEEQKFEVFGQMMTEAEYDAWVEEQLKRYQPTFSIQLLTSCLLSDLAGIKAGLKELPEDCVHQNTNLFSASTPLYYITLYNKMAWEPSCWGGSKGNGSELLTWMKRRTTEVEEFWKEYMRVEKLPEPNYQQYAGDDFRASLDFEDETYILDGSRESYIAQGCRNVDLDLYIATTRFEYDKVEELLQQGANPNAELYCIEVDEDGFAPSISADDYISSEICWYSDNLLPILEDTYAGKEPEIDWTHFDQLLGLAAYIKMGKLFEKYRYIWDKKDDKESI